jgi:hypothetical protein
MQGTLPPSYIIQAAATVSDMLPMLAAPATVFSVLVTLLPDIQLPATAANDESLTAADAANDGNRCLFAYGYRG